MSGGGFTLSKKSRLLLVLITVLLLAGSAKGFVEAFAGHSTLVAVLLFILSSLGLVLGLVVGLLILVSTND